MKFCGSCGEKIIEKSNYCNKCGEKISKKIKKENITSKVEEILDTPNTTKSFNKKDIENNKVLAAISYIGILVLIPYFNQKDSKFVKFHANQGMNLLILWIVYYVFYGLVSSFKINTTCMAWFGYEVGNYCQVTPWWIIFPLNILGIGIFALVVIGISNVINGKAKELPLIGHIRIF